MKSSAEKVVAAQRVSGISEIYCACIDVVFSKSRKFLIWTSAEMGRKFSPSADQKQKKNRISLLFSILTCTCLGSKEIIWKFGYIFLQNTGAWAVYSALRATGGFLISAFGQYIQRQSTV